MANWATKLSSAYPNWINLQAKFTRVTWTEIHLVKIFIISKTKIGSSIQNIETKPIKLIIAGFAFVTSKQINLDALKHAQFCYGEQDESELRPHKYKMDIERASLQYEFGYVLYNRFLFFEFSNIMDKRIDSDQS